MNLNLVDKILLFELDINARQSLNELGKKLNLSKKGVDYKIKKLEEENIILGYKAIIDSSKLGFYFFRILISFKNKDSENLEKFEKYLKSNNNFSYVFKSQGDFDYACALWCRSILEFKNLIDEIYFNFNKNINKIEEHLPTYVTHLQNRFLLKENQTKQISIGGEINEIKLDNIEKNILKILGENAKTPIFLIANELGVDSKLISYRIKKLEKLGIILGYRAILNYKKLGYTYFKCILNFHNIDKKEFNLIKQHLIMDSSTIFINHGIGFGTFDISAVYLTIEEFYSFIENLKNRFPSKLESYQILLFGENVKYNYVPFL